MELKPISTIVDLEELAEPWHCLSRGIPFRSLDWLASWWRHYGKKSDLMALAVYDQNGILVGMAPWHIEQDRSGGRILRCLGSGDVCSDYLSLLTTPEHEDQVIAAVAQWLSSHASASHASENGSQNGKATPRWDLLELSGIAADDRPIAKLVEKMAGKGYLVHRRAGMNCWRIELPDTWEEYVASLSKSHRKQVRRVERRLLDTGKAQLRTAKTLGELEKGMQILIDLHRRRRQSLGEKGCFQCPQFAGFLNEVAQRMFRQHCLQLHWMELAGRPVAAEFHLIGDRTTYAYQAGIDPDALAEEPGRMMNIAVLKNAIAKGQRGFDFLRGDESYKAHWRAQIVPTIELRVVPPRTAAQLRHRMWLTGNRMKHWVKEVLQVAGM